MRDIVERFTADVVLTDGSLVRVRPVHDDDRPLLIEFLKTLSRDTRYLRFFRAGVDPETEVDYLMPGEKGFALLATREGRVIGHAAYARSGRGKAEAGIVVADAYQGKGLGTLLLGHITQAAGEAGIPVLEALVAPENHHVIRVLRDLGFPTEIRSEPGLVRVTFATSFLPEAVERFERREALAAAAAVQTFLRPRGIAVIGASRDRETVGGRILYNLISDGFQGPVYPVNPRAPIVQSMPAYPSVLQCPDPLDLAIVAVPAPAVVPVAKECAQRGVRALVVISAGFAEFGEEGARRQQALVEVCREAGMRLIGPNCMGVVNTDPGVSMNGQFVGVTPRSGSIGFLSQ
ncbi:MAG: GNAT family N-acetyltransferase, partial [Armatimonadetes bacterium]|nr:GNAT family N-acetyltransferase [Armatimonadota bacterium]